MDAWAAVRIGRDARFASFRMGFSS